MTTPVLKLSLGESGAFVDESHGGPSILREVLKAIVDGTPPSITTDLLATLPGAGELGRFIADKAGEYEVSLQTLIEDAGSALTTSVEARLNGVVIAGTAVVTDNAEDDDTTKNGTASNLVLAVGDIVSIHATAVATDMTGLSTSLYLRPVRVE